MSNQPAPYLSEATRASPKSKFAKSELIQVRISAQDKKAFSDLAERMCLSSAKRLRALLVEAVSDGPALVGQQAQAIHDAVRELTALGRNLNQIAKAANQGRLLVDPIVVGELDSVLEHIMDLKRAIAVIVATAKRRKQRLVENDLIA